MNKYRLAGVAVAAVVTRPISAYALNFDFSFTGQYGGVVTGEILGLSASGRSPATDIEIDSIPANFGPPSAPYDFFAKHPVVYTNNFSVSSGNIVGVVFSAAFNSSHEGHTLGLNAAGVVNKYYGAKNTYNIGGIGGITFTPAPAVAAVPEPASIALLGAGLASISAFRRRRKPV